MEEDSAVGSCPNTPVPPNGAVGPNSVRPIMEGVQSTIEGVQPTVENVRPTVQGVQPSSAGIQPGVGDVQPTMDGVRSHSGGTRQDAEIAIEKLAVESEESPRCTSKNEGASGDMYENKAQDNLDMKTECPIPAASTQPADASTTGPKAKRDRQSDSKSPSGASDASKAAAA